MEEKNKNKNGGIKKIFSIIRYVLGTFFILGGLTYFSSSVITAIFLILLGISIFPILYEKINILKYKYVPIILPIILFFIAMAIAPVQENENKNTSINETFPVEEKIVLIKDLNFDETDIEIDIKESKDILLKIDPINATNINELKFNSTNSEIVNFEKNTEKSNENEIYAKIKPISEGECEIFAICNNIESNHIKIKIIDNEKIEQEKKEKEEQAKKEAEEKAKKEAEEAKKQSQSTSTQKNTSSSTSQTTSSKPSTSSSSSQSNSNNSNGKAVYRTPSGKKYHFDPDCGGKNSYSTTLSAAKSAGLTPCQKCAK